MNSSNERVKGKKERLPSTIYHIYSPNCKNSMAWENHPDIPRVIDIKHDTKYVVSPVYSEPLKSCVARILGDQKGDGSFDCEER